MLRVTKGVSGGARIGGRMKNMPQETEDEKAGERKAVGVGGREDPNQSCLGHKPRV